MRAATSTVDVQRPVEQPGRMVNPRLMADPKQPADLTIWQELARKERKGADPAGLVWHTPEGIDVKPLYTRGGRRRPRLRRHVTRRLPVPPRPAGDHVRRPAVDDPPVRRLLDRRGVERVLQSEPRCRADGPLGRVRPRDPSRLRLGSPARGRRRRQGGRRDRFRRGHEDPLRRRAARQDVGLDDDERRRPAGARELHRRR